MDVHIYCSVLNCVFLGYKHQFGCVASIVVGWLDNTIVRVFLFPECDVS